MANVKIDSSDDLDFSTGNLVLIDGAAEIGQKIGVRLRMFLGEWFLDKRQGADHFGVTFTKQSTDFERRNLLQSIVLGTPGVKELLSFTFAFNPETRGMAVTFKAVVAGSDEPVDFSQEFILT